MPSGLPVMHIDDSDDLTAADERDGQKSFVCVFGKRRERFESRVRQRAPVARDHLSMLCYPTREAFANLHTDFADFAGVRKLRSAQNDLGRSYFEQVNKTCVAACNADDESD